MLAVVWETLTATGTALHWHYTALALHCTGTGTALAVVGDLALVANVLAGWLTGVCARGVRARARVCAQLEDLKYNYEQSKSLNAQYEAQLRAMPPR